MSKSAKKILDTAEQLFYRQSINGVGVDLIRDLSGCSKTTMYTYYKNKQQLVESVLLARDEKFRQSLMVAVGASTGIHALTKILDWHVQWFHADDYKGCLFVRAVAECDDDQQIREIALQHKLWIKELIATHCKSIIGSDVFAEMFYTVLEGMISRFLVEGYDQELAESTKNMLNKMMITLS